MLLTFFSACGTACTFTDESVDDETFENYKKQYFERMVTEVKEADSLILAKIKHNIFHERSHYRSIYYQILSGWGEVTEHILHEEYADPCHTDPRSSNKKVYLWLRGGKIIFINSFEDAQDPDYFRLFSIYMKNKNWIYSEFGELLHLN